jgi:SapC
MARPVLLNNVEHRELRIVTARGAQFKDDVMFALTFPNEFRSVQAYYPIVFAPGKDGSFSPVALFGFRQGQNLFLENGDWQALYLPRMLERGPFMIGQAANGKVIHVDLDDPRLSRDAGERVFLDDGASSRYLQHINGVLASLDEGIEATPAFVAALLEHQLLQPFSLDIPSPDGTQGRFAGFHTINEEKVAGLDAAALGRLNERGYLSAIYMVIASIEHFRTLIDRANKLGAAAR